MARPVKVVAKILAALYCTCEQKGRYYIDRQAMGVIADRRNIQHSFVDNLAIHLAMEGFSMTSPTHPNDDIYGICETDLIGSWRRLDYDNIVSVIGNDESINMCDKFQRIYDLESCGLESGATCEASWVRRKGRFLLDSEQFSFLTGQENITRETARAVGVRIGRIGRAAYGFHLIPYDDEYDLKYFHKQVSFSDVAVFRADTVTKTWRSLTGRNGVAAITEAIGRVKLCMMNEEDGNDLS